jgi:hypothetical protein
MSGGRRFLGHRNKIEQLAEIQVLWRGVEFAAVQRQGRWQLSAEGKAWPGPEVMAQESWSATEERIRTWIDRNVVV